jgi:hypothetical protein
MKNNLLALSVLVGLLAFTSTGAQAHTVHGAGPAHGGPSHSFAHGGPAHGFNHHRYYSGGRWYDCDDAGFFIPGLSLNINL